MVDNSKPSDESSRLGAKESTKLVGWPRVKELLHNIHSRRMEEANDDTPPSLRHVHGNNFIGDHPYLGWETKNELLSGWAQVRDDPARYQLTEPGVAGATTYLVQALTTGVQKRDGTHHPRMPNGGPYLRPDEIREIIDWIDGGMPD
jgi:hypothetical protein